MRLVGAMALMSASLFMGSCATDGFDKETWSSSVKNQTLVSPSSDDITVDKNADGSGWIISWPLVKGASGFKCTVVNVTDPEAPITVFQDSIVDGCNLTFPREEDSNYTLSIQALGNAAFNNQDAESATIKPFSSFSPTWKEVPAGSDISEWFAANPIPADMTEEVCVDLVAGAEYTMSGKMDFGGHTACIRCTTASKPAKVKFTGDAGFIIGNGFTMKNLEIDATASTAAFIVLNNEPAVAQGTGNYYIINDPLYLSNIKVIGIGSRFIYDNKTQYAVKTCIIDNCMLNSTCVEAVPFIHFPNGFINDLTIRNSTIWDSATGANNYFVQYSNAGRCDRAGFSTNSISYTNCTFYNMAYKGQMGNYSAFAGRNTSYFTLKSNIFVNCGNNQVPRRFTSGSNNNAVKSFADNTYFYDGADEEVGTWDESGSQVLGDPQFKDPTHGDFTPKAGLKIGDPRWLK